MVKRERVPLHATGLLKRYGARVILQDCALQVASGEAVVLRGPNGAGKSTLIGCICGTIIPDEGAIAIAGHDLHAHPLAARARLRYLPQEIDVPLGLTGRELLDFYADVHGDRPGLERAVTFTALGDALDRLATTYSVGMRRLLAFATLLPGEADLWILDEPFAGVDEDGRARMMRELERARRAGVGVLLAAHQRDAPELAALGARTVELTRAPETPAESHR